MEDTNRLVSVVIPTHNRADMLYRAVKSVRDQTHEELEIVLVDDASSDGTPEMVKGWMREDSRIKYLRNDRPRGASFARNRGIEAASGHWLALLDDDDEFMRERIARLLRCFDDENWSFVCSDYLSVKKTGTRLSRKPGIIDFRKILWMNYATLPLLTHRRKLLDIGGFDESLSAAQDYDLVVRLIQAHGPAYRLGKALYVYHQEHESTRITSSFGKRFRGYWQFYEKFRRHMTRSQRAYHLYRLRKITGKQFSWSRFFGMVPLRYYPMELNDFLIERTNFYKILNRLTGLWKR